MPNHRQRAPALALHTRKEWNGRKIMERQRFGSKKKFTDAAATTRHFLFHPIVSLLIIIAPCTISMFTLMPKKSAPLTDTKLIFLLVLCSFIVCRRHKKKQANDRFSCVFF
jgi:hypothetical protein